MSKIEAVIFDLFGVIVTDALSQMTGRIAHSNPAGYREIKDLMHLTSKGLVDREKSNKRIAELLGLPLDEYRRQITDGEAKNTELLAYIKVLHHTYKTAILSNISKGGIERRFSQTELDEYFDVVVASGDVGYAKPEPEAYELVADKLGVRLDACVFTDDIEAFCDGARSVGMTAIHYTDFESFKQQLEARTRGNQ